MAAATIPAHDDGFVVVAVAAAAALNAAVADVWNAAVDYIPRDPQFPPNISPSET